MINCGELKIKIDKDTIYTLDILAKNNIRKKEILDYYKDFISNMNKYLVKKY